MNYMADEAKTLLVPRMSLPEEAGGLPLAMAEAGVPWHSVDCQPWAEAFPYKPQVRFRIAHSGSHILLHYWVSEHVVRAMAEADGGPVWEDSCCEFFIQPMGSPYYYNIECNCAGTLLIGVGQGRAGRTAAPRSVLSQVRRSSSLGSGQLTPRAISQPWELSLIIPAEALFRHAVTTFSGKRFRANFYKCGDRLPRPHFLSWQPISLPKPDFHCPAFFGTLGFE
ncbi:MAG: hypothetical protein LUC44_00465 [Prevotellaceae bacterium]|nr:hypothetical protein [Prevotellaceae bacterium]